MNRNRNRLNLGVNLCTHYMLYYHNHIQEHLKVLVNMELMNEDNGLSDLFKLHFYLRVNGNSEV